MASQRDYEKTLWAHLLGHLMGMDWQEVCQSVGADEDLSEAAEARLGRAKDRVELMVLRHAGGGAS